MYFKIRWLVTCLTVFVYFQLNNSKMFMVRWVQLYYTLFVVSVSDYKVYIFEIQLMFPPLQMQNKKISVLKSNREINFGYEENHFG